MRSPAIVLALDKVVQVVLVAVRLALEADVAVRLGGVAIPDKQHKPLGDVPQQKRHIQQFALLDGMNAFVVQLHSTERPPCEDEPEEADGVVRLRHRQPPDQYDLVLLHRHIAGRNKGKTLIS